VAEAVEQRAAPVLRNGGGDVQVVGDGGEHARRRPLGSDELPLEIHDERRGEPEVVLEGRDATLENGHVQGLAGHGDVCGKPRTGPKGGDSHALLVAALRESAATPDGGDPSRQSAPRTRGWLSRTSSAGTPAV